ncbi:MAG: 3-deoxy-D-manno-octulosonic acid kinase [Steroidobacterales bacterium]
MLIAARSMAPFDAHGEALFTPEYWQVRGALSRAARGRGSAWFIATESFEWVLRHYRRGGRLAAHFPPDRYLWTGEARVRSFVEWRLLEQLWERGLPVPEPVGARYCRGGLTYHCDLITRRIAGAAPLSDRLAAGRLAPGGWRSLGATIARFHAAGAYHADLTAHNILMTPGGVFSVIDFDRGRLRAPGPWAGANLNRLQRSLRKVSGTLPAGRFVPADWDELLAGYRDGAG